MSNQRTVSLADVFDSVVNQLRNDRQHLNDLDRNNGNANHGDNMVNNFELVANTLRNTSGEDAGTQLRRAADVLQQQGQGATANIYAQGLREASQQLAGRAGIGIEDLLPFLQGLLGGVQRQTGAQPGQGTLIDSLLPGVMGYIQARNSGRSNGDAIMDAIGSAMRGSRQTYNQPAQYGRSRRSVNQPWQDPGASSATSLLEGIFRRFVNF